LTTARPTIELFDIIQGVNLPFSIDRTSRIKLPYQVADGLRSAIQSGFWKPGERLPSSRELKTALGVSVRAPAEALQMLAAEGLITLREKCGAVVAAARAPIVKGRALLIVPGGAQIRSVSVLMENVRRNLNAAGYLTVTTSVLREKEFVDGDHDPYDLQQLEYDLKTSYSLILLFGSPPSTDGIVRVLAGVKCPFLVLRGPVAQAANCIGDIEYDDGEACAAFAAHCRRAQIGRVVFVRKWREDRRNVLVALRKACAKVEVLTVPQKVERGRSEDLWRMSFAVFERRFEEIGKKWLPGLIVFTDDHCFLGAVMSLLSHGVRVPRDVRLVTATNAGMRPPFTCSIACLENDLVKQAAVISKAVLGFLDHGRPIPKGLTMVCEYVPGETFP